MQATVLVLIAALAGVHGICNEETLKAINHHWNGSPPSDIMAAIGGELTWLTVPAFANKYTASSNVSKEIKCGQTIIGSDALSVASLIYVKDSVAPVVRTYEVSEKEPGLLIFKVNGQYLGTKVYVVSLLKSVFVYYECNEMDTSEGYGGLSARNVNSNTIENDEEFQKEVTDGFAALSAINVEPGPAANTECDSCSEKPAA